MWSWLKCYFSGQHDYTMWCEPGAIFLRCVNCGRRSNGWELHNKRERRQIVQPHLHAGNEPGGYRGLLEHRY